MESTQLQPQLARHAIAIKSVRGLLRAAGRDEARQLAFVFALHTTMAQIEQQERREEEEKRGRGTSRNYFRAFA